MEKKVLFIDMDGVMCDFAGAIQSIAPDLEMGDGEKWEERSKRVEEICQENPDIFKNLMPLPGAIEAVKVLSSKFDIHFLSTPMYSLPESYMHKRIWLENHLQELAEKRLTLTHRKDFSIGDYLIDDTTRHGVDKFKGKHIHFGTDAFPNWEVVTKYLVEDIQYQHL